MTFLQLMLKQKTDVEIAETCTIYSNNKCTEDVWCHLQRFTIAIACCTRKPTLNRSCGVKTQTTRIKKIYNTQTTVIKCTTYLPRCEHVVMRTESTEMQNHSGEMSSLYVSSGFSMFYGRHDCSTEPETTHNVLECLFVIKSN